MKKLLLGIVSILIIVLIGVTIIEGIQIGKFNILGIKAIKTQDEELEEKVKEATKLASTDYQRKIDNLNDEIKKLENEKKDYEEMIDVSTDSEMQAVNQSYDNTIEFLLIRIENHAKSEGVTIELTVTRSSSNLENVYDLNFTAIGPYIGIEEFITDIEDDSKLGFKIENFKMTSSSENGNTVQATFNCKNISITGLSSNTSNISNTMNMTNTTNTTDTTKSMTSTTDTTTNMTNTTK